MTPSLMTNDISTVSADPINNKDLLNEDHSTYRTSIWFIQEQHPLLFTGSSTNSTQKESWALFSPA